MAGKRKLAETDSQSSDRIELASSSFLALQVLTARRMRSGGGSGNGKKMLCGRLEPANLVCRH